MNGTTETKTTIAARWALAALVLALALAFVMVPSLVLAADSDDEFASPASDIATQDDPAGPNATQDDTVGANSSSPNNPAGANSSSPENPVGASSSSPAAEGGTSQPEDAPSSDSYSLRLIVSADDDALRDGDAVLGSHDGVYLIGFGDIDALANAEDYYAENAAWAERDIPLGAADDESPEGAPAPVDETNNALTLLEESVGASSSSPNNPVGASSSSPAGEADAPAPELTPAAENDKPLVALIDTGAPDDPAVVASASFVDTDPADRHGHASAMLEAMKAENPDVQVLAIKALGDNGEGSASSVYAAIEYAVDQGADIINLSLAGYANDENAAIAEAVSHALENGIVVIAAAGNGGYDAAYFTPANIDGVFTVGACDKDGNVLDSSNRGDCASGYVVADSTSVAAARLSGWVSAQFDTYTMAACPFLFAPENATYNNAEAPDPDSYNSLTAAAHKYSGVLTIWEGNAPSGGVSWYKAGSGTWTTGSVIHPKEKLYFYPNYTPGGVSNITNPTQSSWYKYRVTRLRYDAGGAAKRAPLHGVFTNQYGLGRQLISGTGEFTDDLKNGTLVTGEQEAWFHFGYNVKLTLDPGTQNILSRGTTALYVVDSATNSKGEELYNAGVFLKYTGSDIFAATASNVENEMGSSANRITVPTRSDGYTFDGYYLTYTDPWGQTQTKQYVNHFGYITDNGKRPGSEGDGGDSMLAASAICNETNGFDWTMTARWAADGMITLDPDGAEYKGTTGLYVCGGWNLLCGPNKSYASFAAKQKIDVPYRDGYKFMGYYTGKNGGGTLMIAPDGHKTASLTEAANNTTLYANWANASASYVLTLDDNGGSGGPGTFTKTFANVGVTDNFTGFLFGSAYAKQSALKVSCGLASVGKPTMGSPSVKRFMGYNSVKNSASGNTMLLDSNLSETSKAYYLGSCTISATDTVFAMAIDTGTYHSPSSLAFTEAEAVRLFLTGSNSIVGWSTGHDNLASFKTRQITDISYQTTKGSRIGLGSYAFPTRDVSPTTSYGYPGSGYSAGDWLPGGWGSLTIVGTDCFGARFTVNTAGTYLSKTTYAASFEGWDGYWTGQSLGGHRYNVSSPRVVSATATVACSNQTAYATWGGWPIRLKAQGGAFTGNDTYYEVYGAGLYKDELATTSVNALPVASKTGYTFNGWYQEENGEGLNVAEADGSITSEPAAAYDAGDASWCNEADVKYVYADYTPNVYTITLSPQGAPDATSGSSALYEVYNTGVFLSASDADAAAAAESGDGLSAMGLSENPIDVPTWPHHVFMGYYASPTGGERYIDENGYITEAFANDVFTDDATLYARWYDDRAVLPLAGGLAENMPLLWGSAFAIVGASGFVLFRALRPNRAIRRQGVHSAPRKRPSRR